MSSRNSNEDTIKQEVKDSKGIIQVAGNYIKGVPGWILLLVSILLASGIAGSVLYFVKYLDRDSSIEIIDISLIETNEFPIVEFRLRNIGGKVAYIKTAQFKTLDYRSLSYCEDPAMQPVSWIYDVELSKQRITSEKVDQSISPNETDRFQFRISSKGSGISNLYQLKIDLIYNTGTKNKVSSEPFIIEIPKNVQILGSTLRPGKERYIEYLNCIKGNIKNILYFIDLTGKKSGSITEFNSKELEENLRKIEEALIETKKGERFHSLKTFTNL